MSFRSLTSLAVLVTVLVAWPRAAQGGGSSGKPPDLTGVYQSIPNVTVLPGGLRNSGSPSEVSLTPSARAQMKTINPKDDPWRMCQPIGQFRMIARENTVIELLPGTGLIMMLFEDINHGFMRSIYLNRSHAERPKVGSNPAQEFPKVTWFGDSIGRWENDTLVIDAVGFNTRTWLNDAGAQHSEALHTVERMRPIRGGEFLEYKMTAKDPAVLRKPYTYTRYYRRLNRDIEDDVCHEED